MSWITNLFPNEKYSDEEIAFQEKLKLCDKTIDAVFRLIMDLAETHIYQERVVSAFRPDSIKSNWSWYRILWVAKDADPKVKRSIRWLISSGALRHAHDFEFLLSLHHSILKRVAETFAKYESCYWLINIMLSHGLIDDPKGFRMRIGFAKWHTDRCSCRTDRTRSPKTASGRLIDAKEFRYRMRHAWQKPPKWRYFADLEGAPTNADAKTIEQIFNGSTHDHTLRPRRVNWRILPPGKHPFPELIRHFEHLQTGEAGSSIDEERLRKLCELERTDTYTGSRDFQGYIVFDYSKYGFAILECPFVGNAIYVLIGDWRVLSRLTKAELLTLHSDNTIRITHRGDWFSRLEEAMSALRESDDVLVS